MVVKKSSLEARIRWWTLIVMAGLVISGATAIPLRYEIHLLLDLQGLTDPYGCTQWLKRVCTALDATESQQPFLFYATDWLAFAHFVIALAFIGALRDPVRNRWLFDFGLIACFLMIPFALIFGELRGIPLWWRFLDCSFGVLCSIPLWLCRKCSIELERSATA